MGMERENFCLTSCRISIRGKAMINPHLLRIKIGQGWGIAELTNCFSIASKFPFITCAVAKTPDRWFRDLSCVSIASFELSGHPAKAGRLVSTLGQKKPNNKRAKPHAAWYEPMLSESKLVPMVANPIPISALEVVKE